MTILIAILAKDKGHCLPFYLACIYNQTYPKTQTHLYIKTNDNKDNTVEVLKQFLTTHGTEYASVFFDDSNISESLKNYGHHEWNNERFKILGKIRQDSIDHAKLLGADYFVADCDNFIVPETLTSLVKMRDLGVISPMLVTETAYSNFHYNVDANGYMASSPLYMDVLMKRVKGICSVKVVHCTYFINNSLLDLVCYNDNSNRYEYVVFSDHLRKQNIEQYLDNRRFYGFIVFSESQEEIKRDLEITWKSMIDEHF